MQEQIQAIATVLSLVNPAICGMMFVQAAMVVALFAASITPQALGQETKQAEWAEEYAYTLGVQVYVFGLLR